MQIQDTSYTYSCILHIFTHSPHKIPNNNCVLNIFNGLAAPNVVLGLFLVHINTTYPDPVNPVFNTYTALLMGIAEYRVFSVQ